MRRVTYQFRDDEGKVAEASFWLRDLPSFVVYDAVIIALGERLAALSNALLISAELLMKVEFNLGPVIVPAKNANRLLLFYREGAIGYAINVPAAKSTLPYDVDGAYRAIRLRRTAVEMSGLLGDIELVGEDIVFRSGLPVPTVFTVGARTRAGQ